MHLHPRLAKEIRPLLFPWVLVALAMLALGPFSRLTADFIKIRWFVWVVGSAFLAARTFAAEFEDRTLSLWLSQPVTRFEMWRDKFIVLLPALGMLAGLYLTYPDWTPGYPEGTLFFYGLVSVGASVALAPFWVSLVRSTIGTLVFVLATQYIGTVLLLLGREWLFPLGSNLNDARHVLRTEDGGHIILRTVKISFSWLPYYLGAATGFLYAGWRRFARMEAIDGLPRMGAAPGTTESGSRASMGLRLLRAQPQGAWRNLMRKELHLHRPNFLFAAVFITTVLAIGVLDANSSSREVRSVIEVLRFFPFVIYGFALTLFAGSIAFCEEKSLGTHTWSLTQPSGIRAQFLIKLGISFSVFVVLGLLLPFTALLLYPGALPNTGLQTGYAKPLLQPLYQLSMPLCAGFILSFWSASLAPNVVRAGLTLLVVGFGTVLALGNSLSRLTNIEPFPIDYSGWMATLANGSIRVLHYDIKNVVLLGVSLAILLVLYPILAAYANFRRVAISSFRTVSQLLVFLGLFCGSVFGFAFVGEQPNRIGYGEYWLMYEVSNAVKKLDASNPNRSPGDVQTYSWQQVESTGLITAKTWSRVANTPRMVTVTTTRLLPARTRPNRTYSSEPKRQVKIQIQPELQLPASKNSQLSRGTYTNIPW